MTYNIQSMEMKFCNLCETNKSIEDFNKKVDGYQSNCVICTRKQSKIHYENNKNKYFDKNKKRNIKLKNEIDELKNIPCMDCKNKFPSYVMDFDHKYDKRFNISQGYKAKSREKLLEEINKCDVVCANCHRIRTHLRSMNIGE
jgi:hypothetical protein